MVSQKYILPLVILAFFTLPGEITKAQEINIDTNHFSVEVGNNPSISITQLRNQRAIPDVIFREIWSPFAVNSPTRQRQFSRDCYQTNQRTQHITQSNQLGDSYVNHSYTYSSTQICY